MDGINFYLTPAGRILSFYEICAYSKYGAKDQELKQELKRGFGRLFRQGNIYFLMQRRFINIKNESVCYDDNALFFTLTNGLESVRIRLIPPLEEGEVIEECCELLFDDDNSLIAGIAFTGSSGSKSQCDVYSITTDLAQAKRSSLDGRDVFELNEGKCLYEVINGDVSFVLKFNLSYIGSAVGKDGAKQRLLNAHHIVERLACTTDVIRPSAKIGFELCALPLIVNKLEVNSSTVVGRLGGRPIDREANAHEIEKALIRALKPKENEDGQNYENYPREGKTLPRSVSKITISLAANLIIQHDDSVFNGNVDFHNKADFVYVDRKSNEIGVDRRPSEN